MIGGLRSGDYLLIAHPTPRYRPPLTSVLIEHLVPTWYPNAVDSSSASVVHVGPGGEARDIEIRMRTARTFLVRGRVDVPADATSVPDGLSLRAGPIEGGYGTGIEKGSFEFTGVLPGSYTLESSERVSITRDKKSGAISSVPPRFFAHQQVEVDDHDVEGVIVHFTPGVELSGVFHFEKVKLNKSLSLRLLPDKPFAAATEEREADADEHGAFHFSQLHPTKFKVEIRDLPDDAYIQSIRYEGHEVAGSLDLNSGADSPLEITLAPNAAEIEGALRDENGDLVPDAVVFLWSSDSDRAKFANTGPDGTYGFANLAPGEYHIAAWDDDDFEPEGPEVRKLYESQTVTVKVQEGSHETADLKLIVLK